VETSTTATRRSIAIGLVLALLAVALWSINEDRADAAATPQAAAAGVLAQIGDNPNQPPVEFAGGWFAKYDGIDGESKDANHDKWIDVLSYDWGMRKPGGAATGQSRRRGAPIVEPFEMTFEYEKASPKLLEKCLLGEIIPKLEVELTANYGGARATYLKYEMKNVSCKAYHVGGYADGTPPTVVIANNFEEIKVTYTEYDSEGNKGGNVETSYKVERSR
jgi:type VI secretion system secreted protein Hcp